MTLAQLRYFLQVCRQGSMQKASTSLYVSQQAVSKAIRSLEDELGILLFTRTATGMVMTEAGAALYDDAVVLLQQVDRMKIKMQAFRDDCRGHVNIGFLQGHLGSEDYMPIQVLRTFQEEYPEITIDYEIMTNDLLLKELEEGKLDLIFTHGPAAFEGFKADKLYDFSWFMVMGKDHPYADYKQILPAQLAGQKIIYLKQEIQNRRAIESHFEPGNEPEFILVDQNLPYSLIQQEVLNRQAIRFYASPFINTLNFEYFVAIPIRWDFLKSQVYAVKRKENKAGPVKCIKDYLLQHWGHKLYRSC